MKQLFFISCIFFLFGCASKKERTEKFLSNNPEYLAQLCALNFPSTEKLIPGKTIIDTVTIAIPGVQIPCPEYVDENGNKQQTKVPCPQSEIKYVTKYKTDTLLVENTANVLRLSNNNFQLKKDLAWANDQIDSLSATKTKLAISLAVTSLFALVSLFILIKK